MNKITRNKTRIKEKIESLEEESLRIRAELEDELETSKDRILDIGKIALGIGGGIIFSAIVLRGIVGRRDDGQDVSHKYKSKKVYQRFREQLVRELSMQATKFLLKMAKDKLSTYIEEKDKTGGNDSEVAD